MKDRYKGKWSYCDKSDCEFWNKCTLAATEERRQLMNPEIKEHHACYQQKDESNVE